MWDRHATGANDSRAECVLELRDLYKNVQLAQSRVHEVPRQFYALTHPLYPGQQGKADLSISMMNRPVAEALENIAGIGRGAPNQNPYLPPPDRSSQFAAARSRSSLGGLSLRRSVRDDRAGQSVAAAGGGGGELLVGGAGGDPGGAEGGGGRGSTKEARKEARKEAKEARKEAKEARKEAAARKTEKRRSSVAGKRASTSAESDGANGSAAVGSGYSADEGEATDDQQSASAALAAGGAAPGVAGAPPPEVSKRPSLFRRLSRRRTSSGVELS